MSSRGHFKKRPGEVETFGINYTDRLDNPILSGDTIAASTWTVPAGITKVSDSIYNGNLAAAVLLSGGTDGEDYVLENSVDTAAGRTLEAVIVIHVRS